jgi:signal transduction histidine kinase
MTAGSVVARSSLFRRLLLGFAATVAVMWLTTAAFTIGWAFRLGDQQIAKGLQTYARQVMAAAVVFADDPDRLARALEPVQSIERENAGPDAAIAIQVWKAGEHIGPAMDLPRAVPEVSPPFQTYEHAGRRYRAYVAVDPVVPIVVRTSVGARGAASLMWPSAGFVFVPLLISLPFLLIPAWLTIRRGLRPLRTLVDAIEDRVRTLKLEPVAMSAYRELTPLVAAVNELMGRLRGQLDRERAFVADVAHEIKTPLAIVRANLDAIRAPASAERRDAALTDLGMGVDRADTLIRRLLQLARMEHDGRDHAWRRFDLTEFIRQRVAAMVPLADLRRIAVVLQADEGLACTSDPDAIGAILDNLLDNAIKFSPPGSTVNIVLEASGPGAVLWVGDEGPGIASHLRDAAFERFARVDVRDLPGTGLGLAIVRRAVARISGSLSLEAARALEPPGQGGPGASREQGEGLLVRVGIPFEPT